MGNTTTPKRVNTTAPKLVEFSTKFIKSVELSIKFD